jgi:hypothetical protein
MRQVDLEGAKCESRNVEQECGRLTWEEHVVGPKLWQID